MTFADLMAMKRVSDPQISPSGKWVLFSVMDVDLAKNTKTNHLWVVPMGAEADSSASDPAMRDRTLRNDKQNSGGGAERQVTFGAGESFGRFSPDGAWVSWTQNPGKGESFARIVVAAWDEKTRAVGAGKALTGISGDADGAVWSPDSKRLMLTTQVWPECSVRQPTLRDNTAKDGPPESVAGIEIGGTRDGAAWKATQPAAWAEEDACDKAKDEAAEKNPVKAQVWDGLLYRHWDQFTGAKRTHILVAELAPDTPTRPQDARTDGAPERSANPPELRADGAPGVAAIRDVTTARDVGDAETPTWMLGGPQEYAWAPDSKEIAYVTNLDTVPAASTNNDVFTLRVDEPNARPVKVSTSAGSDDEPEYSPDGRWLAFRSQRQAGFESDLFRLMVYDREKKTAREYRPALLNPNGTRFDDWVDEYVWSGDSYAIFFASGYEGTESVFELDLGTLHGDEPYFGQLTLNGEYSDLRLFDTYGIDRDGTRRLQRTTLIATKMTADRPSEIVSEDLGHIHTAFTGPIGSDVKWFKALHDHDVALTHLNHALLPQLDLSPLEPFWFTGAEGTKVEGFLIKPPGFDAKKKYPLKFIMHGGPQTMAGDGWSYRWNWELMAASGYVVIDINRRGPTGYGQKFVEEVSGDWGGRAYEDLMKGLDYAEAKYPFIDKTRECALGASYGGFMADWVLTHTNRFKCIVTHDGLYDAGAAYGTTEEMWFPEWEFRRPEDYPKGWDGFAPNPKQTTAGHAAEPWRYASLSGVEDPFRKWSPKEYIQNAKTPTLIIHSQKDYRLDVSQGFELYSALQRLGMPSRFLYFPDEGHWVLKPKDSELWNAVVSDWCDRWTHTGKYAQK